MSSAMSGPVDSSRPIPLLDILRDPRVPMYALAEAARDQAIWPILVANGAQRAWVRDPAGAKLYFRYFDPRVLRTALGAMSQEELADFMGPVLRFLCEVDSPDGILCWSREAAGVRAYRIAVACEP